MTWCAGHVVVKCPLCGSLDGDFQTLSHSMLCELSCSCAKDSGYLVWDRDVLDDGGIIERVYYPDGSVKHIVLGPGVAAPDMPDQVYKGRPIFRRLEEQYPADQLSVRVFTAEEIAEEIRLFQKANRESDHESYDCGF